MKSYQISREGQVLGEFVESQIQEGLQSGYFRPSDWCWSDGMTEWQGVGAVFRQPQPQPSFVPHSLPPPPESEVRSFEPAVLNPYAAPKANVMRTMSPAVRQRIEPASLGARFGANFIDNLILVLCFLPTGLLGVSEEVGNPADTWMLVGLGVFAVVLVLNCAFIASNGQTIGKRMVGIRTVRMDDGEKAGFLRIVFLRFLVGQGLLGMIPLWNLIDILFIFGDERRCLHDKIAGTQVIDA
jgi:uncharacterized RDD family membrane protein YckC